MKRLSLFVIIAMKKYQFSRDELKQIFAEASRNDGAAH